MPFHFVMQFTVTPPAVQKPPPTYRLLPLTAIDKTPKPFIPIFEPIWKAEKEVPFHMAMRFTVTSPAVVNKPPRYTLLPFIANTLTISFTPADEPIFRAEKEVSDPVLLPVGVMEELRVMLDVPLTDTVPVEDPV